MYVVTNKSQEMFFFINIFILGRSGVKQTTGFLFSLLRCTEKTTPIVNIHSMCYEKYGHVQWLLGLSKIKIFGYIVSLASFGEKK